MSSKKLDIIIVLIGRICSGKSTVAKVLSERLSFPLASFGNYLIAYCGQKNLPTDRASLQKVGQEMVNTNPTQFLQNVIDYHRGDSTSLVLDGIRHKVIFESVKGLAKNVVAVFMDADLETRYKRYLTRNIIDYKTFLVLDTHPVELETEILKPFCDVVIDSTVNYENVLYDLIKKIAH